MEHRRPHTWTILSKTSEHSDYRRPRSGPDGTPRPDPKMKHEHAAGRGTPPATSTAAQSPDRNSSN
nr:MAG TPA: hypothetical protein [Caudoviricetes sp.]